MCGVARYVQAAKEELAVVRARKAADTAKSAEEAQQVLCVNQSPQSLQLESQNPSPQTHPTLC